MSETIPILARWTRALERIGPSWTIDRSGAEHQGRRILHYVTTQCVRNEISDPIPRTESVFDASVFLRESPSSVALGSTALQQRTCTQEQSEDGSTADGRLSDVTYLVHPGDLRKAERRRQSCAPRTNDVSGAQASPVPTRPTSSTTPGGSNERITL